MRGWNPNSTKPGFTAYFSSLCSSGSQLSASVVSPLWLADVAWAATQCKGTEFGPEMERKVCLGKTACSQNADKHTALTCSRKGAGFGTRKTRAQAKFLSAQVGMTQTQRFSWVSALSWGCDNSSYLGSPGALCIFNKSHSFSHLSYNIWASQTWGLPVCWLDLEQNLKFRKLQWKNRTAAFRESSTSYK